MDWFKLSYGLLGGIGIFFFGLKLLSESLQSAAGDWVRHAISILIRNRFVAVAVGAGVTAVIQSSTITTVMVIGFVNAGLMDLFQAIGVIFGANIGTTITGWIISINVGQYALLFIGLGFIPMMYAKSAKLVTTGKILFALGFIFFGLSLMTGSLKPLQAHPGFNEAMTHFQVDSWWNLYAAIGVGALLTMMIHSSAAMLAISVALATTGLITFQTALALVMGSDVGTTITAMMASIGANVNARRAAYAHSLFNVIGVVVVSLFFWPYERFIEWLIASPADFVNAENIKPYAAVHIATGQTIFNVVNVLIFLPFVSQLQRLVCFLVPDKGEKQIKHLELFGNISTLSAPMAINQVALEMKKMTEMVRTMLQDTQKFIFSSESNFKQSQRVKKYEGITDNIQMEVTVFLGQIMQAQVTPEDSGEIKKYMRVADELESIADYCLSLVKYEERRQNETAKFDADTKRELEGLFAKVVAQFEIVDRALQKDSSLTVDEFRAATIEFNQLADAFKDHHLTRIGAKLLSPLASLIVSDMAVAMRRLKNHTVNVAEALNHGRKITVVVSPE